MAIPRPFRRSIKEELERLWRLNTDADGRSDLGVIKTLLGAYLIAHPDHLDAQRQANAIVDDWERSRRPYVDPMGQASMFDADALLPVGKNERKQMGKAKQSDLVAWAAISSTEHAADAAAHARRLAYIGDRLQAAYWPTADTTLSDVERDQFPASP